MIRPMTLCWLFFSLTVATQSQLFAQETKPQEFELRSYLIDNADDHTIVANYVKTALLPALNRQKVDRVGVFKLRGKKDTANKTHAWPEHSIHVLIPFPTLEAFSALNLKLADDADYQKAADQLFGVDKQDPAYNRIESRFMKAFAGMPVVE